MSKKIKKILLKKKRSKIVCLTAYSKNFAKILDRHCDIILVGDSMANVLYGMKNTHKVTLDTIIQHSISVRKGINKSLLVVDMPKGSYRNPLQAKKNAKLIFKKTNCDAVKIESNNKNFKIIREITRAKIPVMGHIGFTPQFKKIITSTPLNEISEPIMLKDGILFLMVREKRKFDGEVDLEKLKNNLVNTEKSKILNMYSMSHYDSLRRSVTIKFLNE